ncbi:FkbM family methyltransferase [Methylocapsa acidiphila]|uniref:FkbM family methyltransferase n=1 Tax=Methylocapsa acidiphila TaxID=133552 RepID=UPI0003FB6414|nr:FkbM family methyltransferase [Methylocapsa acidiphila]
MPQSFAGAISTAVGRFNEYCSAFGVWSGSLKSLEHLIKYKSGLCAAAVSTLTPNKHRVWLRPRSTDLATYREVFINREYDIRKLKIFDAIIRRYNSLLTLGRVPLIVDAGANIGLTSIFLSPLFPKADFLLIEASSHNLPILERNVGNNPRMRVLHHALWHEKSKLSLVDESGFSMIRVQQEADGQPGDSVDTITMAEVLGARNDDLFILKIDIEGAENVVLSKNNHWLSSRPIILIEPHDDIIPNNGSLAGLLNVDEYRCANIIISGSNLFIVPQSYVNDGLQRPVA